MPTQKTELVRLCNLWKVPLPDLPQNLRVIDPQDALWAYDGKLSMGTFDPKALVESWASKKITFGQKHRNKSYEEVCVADPGYCEWIRGSATHVYEGMRQFIQYVELREEATRNAPEPEVEQSSRRPRARARRSSSPPARADERMADGARKRLPSDDSWEDGAVCAA